MNTQIIQFSKFCLIAVALIMACKKSQIDKKEEIDYWTSQTTGIPEREKLKAILALERKSKEFSFTAESYTRNEWKEIEIDPYTFIYLPTDGWLDSVGNKISGKIDCKINFASKISDNIFLNMPTQTNNSMLVSGGSFKFSVTKDGKTVQNAKEGLVNIKLKEKYKYQTFDSDENLDWNLSNLANNRPILSYLYRGNGTYARDSMFSFKIKFKEVNVDYYLKNEGKKLKIKLPNNFGPSNTNVFLLFKDIYSVGSCAPNVSSKLFESLDLPIGANVIVLVMAKIGEKYYYATKELRVSESMTIDMNPAETNKYEMIYYLEQFN